MAAQAMSLKHFNAQPDKPVWKKREERKKPKGISFPPATEPYKGVTVAWYALVTERNADPRQTAESRTAPQYGRLPAGLGVADSARGRDHRERRRGACPQASC
jgi:hypothetical protein